MRYDLMTVLLGGTALMLSGCATSDPTIVPTVPCHTNTYGPYQETTCAPGVEITVPIGSLGTGSEVISAINFSAIKFDMTGTTVSLPASGQFTIILSGQSGQTIGTSSFSWVRNGDEILTTEVQSIENWIGFITADIHKIDLDLIPMVVGTTQGTNVASLTVDYNSSPVAMAASVWTECPSGGSQVMLCG